MVVVVIEEVYEGEYYKDKRLQSLYSCHLINVHVTLSVVGWQISDHPFWSHGILKAVKRTNYHRIETIRRRYFIPSSCRCISSKNRELC
jgi:hypothetical protein